MKMSELILSTILKKGTMVDIRNIDTEIVIPAEETQQLVTIMAIDNEHKSEIEPIKTEPIKIIFKAEHLQIKIDKGE